MDETDLRLALGSRKPARVTQPAFDFDDRHLRRLVELGPHEAARGADVHEYTNDLLYANEIQVELLTYLLPVVLRAWRDDLRGTHRHGGFVENISPALAHPRVRDLLDPKQRAAISAYSDMLELRCAELPRLLATTQRAGALLEWAV